MRVLLQEASVGAPPGDENARVIATGTSRTTGAPSFVQDPPGDDVIRDPRRVDDIKTYVRNAARWLAPRSH